MARLLIQARDNHRAHNPKGRLGVHYRPGDPIVVTPDGHVWGRKETLPVFYQVDVPGPVERVSEYLEKRIHTVPEAPGEPFREVMDERRQFCLDLAKLPAGKRAQLREYGQVNLTDREFLRAFIRKQDGRTEWARGQRGFNV
jgi:hypothetical protein